MKKNNLFLLLLLGFPCFQTLKAEKNSILPENWLSQTIGTTGQTGFAEYNNGTFTIQGAGKDIWDTKDAFFMICKSMNGNMEMTVRLKSQTNTDPWAKAGLMFRENLTDNSKHLLVAITPSNSGGSFSRSASGWGTSYDAMQGMALPYWVKLIRMDNLMAAYGSKDGQVWKKIGSTFDFSMNQDFYGGLVVCSHNETKLCSVVFDSLSIKKPDPSLQLSDKGLYFAKKKYVPTPIPSFAVSKDLLPKPILDGNPGWINMYYKAWQLGFAHMKAPENGSPFVSNWYDEAFDDKIYQWDITFMTLFGRYAHHLFPGIESLDNFYCRQHISGCITRILTESNGSDYGNESSPDNINPPLFSWAEVENYKITGDKSRFESVLPVLEKYYEFVDAHRNGYDTPHKLFWNNGQASGMDNTPRDEGRPNEHWASDHQGWVDMSCQMVIQCNNLATICDELGYTEKAGIYRGKAKVIADNINQFLWNEPDGMYYDVDVNGKQTNWKTAASFWPMLAGITTAEKEAKLIANLKNPKSFWRDMVFPTLAADQKYYSPLGGYWLGAVWAPTNYAIIKGLERTGNNDFAKQASEKYLEGLYRVYLSTGTLWENYAPDLVNGNFKYGTNESNVNPCRKDFVGWTGLGPISLLIENVLGFRVNGAKREMIYDLRRLDHHGIQNLRMNDITTSVDCALRSDTAANAYIQVTTDKPYQLIILRNGKTHTFALQTGTTKLVISDSLNSALTKQQKGKPSEYILYRNLQSKMLYLEVRKNVGDQIDIALFDDHGQKVIKVYNATKNDESCRKQLDVSGLAKGVYFLQFKSKKQICSEKILLD